jgi:PAS domain S-box-containing protein
LLALLDHRFDEFAADTHENLAPRAAVAAGAGLVALTLLPWQACLCWTLGALGLEAWGWFASRRQFLRRTVSRDAQIGFLGYVASLVGAWSLLAWLFWLTGGIEGAICAMIIWVSVVGFAQTFASRTPLGFAVCGVAPALGVLAAVTAGPSIAGLHRTPVLGIMALAAAFAVAGARQTFAAGRRLHETRKALQSSETQYRTLADSMADVVGRFGLDGAGWQYISPSVEEALGYAPAEFMKLTADDYVHPEDAPQLLAVFRDLSEAAPTAKLQYRQVRKRGDALWVETTFSLVCDPRTGAREVICASRDITARKSMECDLVEARERAEAAAAAKADFLANMTHELRTPLNAIIGFSGVLQSSNHLTERDARHAHLINDASATLLSVVNSVLDFSKLESGAFEFDPQPFEPLAIAASVAALVEDQARTRGLALRVIGEGDPRTLLGDGPRLRQVLLNLISNALKFTTEGGVTVRVAQDPAPGFLRRLRVSVTDTGIGISGDKLEAVFERFNQADVSVSRRFGGTGLGLAICKRIVSLMGGRIGVESEEGRGSTFWFELDLPEADAAAALSEAVEAPVELERPVRLLLVEDVAVNRELVRVILEPFDVEIHTATNGCEAIEAVGRAAYDLVLMDVQMPVMDGLTAARRIRELEDPSARRVPIIAMTANVLPDQIERCLDAGMDGHLGKPINPGALLQAISAWTSGAPAEAERAAVYTSKSGA